MPETNGVESAPRPLHVVIVGAGIGGCTAALALRQQGHNVTVCLQLWGLLLALMKCQSSYSSAQNWPEN